MDSGACEASNRAGNGKLPSRGSRFLPALFLAITCLPGMLRADESGDARWQADHHVHVASAEICARLGDCLEHNFPPAVTAEDALVALDAASVRRGVVISSAYLYGLPSLGLDDNEVMRHVRAENAFALEEAARHPDRLVAFFSVDLRRAGAVDEIAYWAEKGQFAGLKLHLAAAGLDVARPADRQQLVRVFQAAGAQGLPLLVHIGGGGFDASAAAILIDSVLPAAGDAWVQIAHAGGGYPIVPGRQAAILAVFADRIAAGDETVSRVLFDLSFVPAPEDSDASLAALVREMRRSGLVRFLFGSDFNVRTPLAQAEALRRLGLTDAEMTILEASCAPWVCPGEQPQELP